MPSLRVRYDGILTKPGLKRKFEKDVFHDVWVVKIEPDGIISMDFIKKHNCQLTLGQGHYELPLLGMCLNWLVEKSCQGVRELLHRRQL